jgi:serine/threonine protein kinase
MDRPQQEILPFKEITLLKSDVLGAGAYGQVCRAVCDGLPCAAKIIHSTLFDLRDPGVASFRRRFDEECHLLSRVRHPNIVLYLATYSDLETSLPVLLMELCDESLTHFLEHSKGTTPYHTEVDITHDVVLALVYLHANKVIHRDLTGNNVLLIAGSRAKVTDFGMSKLASVNPRMTPLTACPGNMLYMSPEALNEVRPSYTKKLDVFSLGVLLVQILTRLFPNPGARFKVMDVSQDSRFGSRTVNVPVPETERREEHLNLISDGHPLKQLALNCIKDDDKKRPSALELSSSLQGLKESQLYRESKEPPEDEAGGPTFSRARLNSLRVQVHEMKQREIRQQQKQIHQKREFETRKQQEIQELTEEVKRLQTALREKESELQDACSFKETAQATIERQERELEASQQLVKDVKQKLQLKEKDIEDFQSTISSLLSAMEQPTHHVESGGPAKLPQQNVHNRPLQRAGSEDLARPPHQQDIQNRPLQRAGSREHDIRNPPVRHMDSRELVRPPQQDSHNALITMRIVRNITAPECVKRGSAAVYLNTAFITPEDTHKVYQITNGVDRWNCLTDHPFKGFGLVVLSDGCITSIGGWNGTTHTNQLLTLNKARMWVSGRYPPMLTARIEGAVVSSRDALVVAGGFDGQTMLDTVEVLTLYNMQWATASRMPHPFYSACAALCGDQMYIAGGYVADGVKSKSVLTCSLTDLIYSLSPANSFRKVWREAGQLPYTKSTLVSQGERLLAVGGKDDAGHTYSDVLTYDRHSMVWRHVSNLNVARNQCFALSFPADIVFVTGGDPKTVSTEVITFMESTMRL